MLFPCLREYGEVVNVGQDSVFQSSYDIVHQTQEGRGAFIKPNGIRLNWYFPSRQMNFVFSLSSSLSGIL